MPAASQNGNFYERESFQHLRPIDLGCNLGQPLLAGNFFGGSSELAQQIPAQNF
jgi:hypothetical protein